MPTKLRRMREKVLDELKHIPKGALPEGELRAMYWMQRMHSLGKKVTNEQTTKQVLEKSLTYLKKDYPDFEFKYNKEFFDQK